MRDEQARGEVSISGSHRSVAKSICRQSSSLSGEETQTSTYRSVRSLNLTLLRREAGSDFFARGTALVR